MEATMMAQKRKDNIQAKYVLNHGVRNNPPVDDEITPPALAEMLHVSHSSIMNWIKKHRMPVHRMTVGIRRKYYLSLDEIEPWLREKGIIE